MYNVLRYTEKLEVFKNNFSHIAIWKLCENGLKICHFIYMIEEGENVVKAYMQAIRKKRNEKKSANFKTISVRNAENSTRYHTIQ